MTPIIMIPARLGSRRFPGKPLASIGGKPLIVHVWERAMASGLGRVVVACGDYEIMAAVREADGEGIMTDPTHPSGSDRIFEALRLIDPGGHYDVVVNLQGDLPMIDPGLLGVAARVLDNPAVDIGTLVAEGAEDDPNVVKAMVSGQGRALYFTRTMIPLAYRHIGVYAYRRAALERFAGLPVSLLERREGLEQLRALEAGMRIDVAVVDRAPRCIDTPEDLVDLR